MPVFIPPIKHSNMSLKIELQPRIPQEFKAKQYILHPELKNAVEVAIALDMPLLLTGEPGTGKTKLAKRVAYDLHRRQGSDFAEEPLVFNTKTTSEARDLFYTYDALSHFQVANLKNPDEAKPDEQAPTDDDPAGPAKNSTGHFLELQALGKAIAFSNPAAFGKLKTRPFRTKLPAHAQSSVVLIDEIDKAPRDFTNDILDEIDNYRFEIKEQDNFKVEYLREQQQRIVVIMTSNSEKNLPDAFLRRCVFYDIPFPKGKLLEDIVKTQLGKSTKYTDDMLKTLIAKFEEVRGKTIRKAPATAELISWLRVLEVQNFITENEDGRKKRLLDNLSLLVKTREDMEAVKGLFT